MRRKPKYLRSEGFGLRDRWLISYTDVVTILLIVFVSVAAEGLKARVAEPIPTPAISVPMPPIPIAPIPTAPPKTRALAFSKSSASWSGPVWNCDWNRAVLSSAFRSPSCLYPGTIE